MSGFKVEIFYLHIKALKWSLGVNNNFLHSQPLILSIDLKINLHMLFFNTVKYQNLNFCDVTLCFQCSVKNKKNPIFIMKSFLTRFK